MNAIIVIILLLKPEAIMNSYTYPSTTFAIIPDVFLSHYKDNSCEFTSTCFQLHHFHE